MITTLSPSKQNPSNTRTETLAALSQGLTRPLLDSAYSLLLMRLVLGLTFAAHGSQKLFGWFGGYGLDGTAQFFATLGLPVAVTYLVAFTEFFGGLALIAGLLTRPAALGLFATMLGAIITVHLPAGFFAPNGVEFPLALGTLALVLFLNGSGKFSFDHLLLKR